MAKGNKVRDMANKTWFIALKQYCILDFCWSVVCFADQKAAENPEQEREKVGHTEEGLVLGIFCLFWQKSMTFVYSETQWEKSAATPRSEQRREREIGKIDRERERGINPAPARLIHCVLCEQEC